ncbi:MAG: ATPase [Chloroflexi bacterium]|nr:MAG: ATPase [Chloroflexota bacterium]
MTLTRYISAPRELVFEAWTNPEHLLHWWGPRGFRNTFHEFDMRPGGVWRFTMHGPDGVGYANHVVFGEVVEPESITYSHHAEHGTAVELFDVRVLFAAENSGTRLTLEMTFPTPEALRAAVEDIGAIEGGHSTLERLAEYVATM